MQDNLFYQTILGELSHQELMEVVGREIRRRQLVGIVLGWDRGTSEVRSAFCHPQSWNEIEGLDDMTLAGQLYLLANLMDLGKEVGREKIVGGDDQGDLFE